MADEQVQAQEQVQVEEPKVESTDKLVEVGREVTRKSCRAEQAELGTWKRKSN